jgi:pimeloyl-ACP methyl ester carboxylesterase
VEVAGRAVAYRRAGAGPPLLLLHGGWSDGRQWAGQLERLADAFHVVAWDAPGCGASDDLPPGAALGDYADALAGLAAALGLERPHVCGLSWGGGLALELCRRHPGLPRSLVLVGAYAGWAGSLPPEEVRARLERAVEESRHPPAEWAEGYLDGFFAGPVPDEVRAAQLRMVLDVRPAGAVAMIRAFAEADLRPALPDLAVPVLVLNGEEDARASPDVARRLHAAIPGAALVLLPDVGHVVNLEAPEAFERELRGFLTSVG